MRAQVAILVLSLALGACASSRGGRVARATWAETREGLPAAVEAPLADLNLRRRGIDPTLVRASAAPYESGGLWTCEAVAAELGALDAALGPDLDRPGPQQEGEAALARSLAGAAVTGVRAAAVSVVPARGVVRELSGAARADAEQAKARVAGAARRGFVRAVWLQLGCASAVQARGGDLPLPAYAVRPAW